MSIVGTNFSEIWIKKLNIFIQENAFEIVVCEMASIMSRPKSVKRTNGQLQNENG